MSSKQYNPEAKRQIILNHYEEPTNKIADSKKKIENYISCSIDSASCIDHLTAFVKLEGNKIKDIKFNGVGCAIATSSTDVMADILKNKTIAYANKFIDNYFKMIDGLKYDAEILNDLNVFDGVNKQFSRIKCAKIGIEAISKAINQGSK
jgi:nitrogen fixation NifU-like protein